MDSSCCNQQKKHEIMFEGHEGGDDGDLGSASSSSSDTSRDFISSPSSDFTDDATTMEYSSASAFSPDPLSSNSPLFEMSSLMQELPFKRGLSKYYQGKSQSFTSLSNVKSLEDLAKPENPYNKKLKTCKSYGGLSECQKSWSPKTSSKTISKKPSRASCYAANVRKNNSFMGTSRPPVHPQRTNSLIA